MKRWMEKLEEVLGWGNPKDVTQLVLSGLAVAGSLADFVALSDTLWQEGGDMVARLTAPGVRLVLVTGDHESAAQAIRGVLNPVVGALVYNAGSVLVIVNSALLLKWRRRFPRETGKEAPAYTERVTK